MKKFLMLFSVMFLFCACAEPSGVYNDIVLDKDLNKMGYDKVALNIRSEQGLAPVIRFYPWLKSGDISKDALVLINSSDGASREVPYSNEKACYYDYLISSVNNEYKIVIREKGKQKNIEFNFIHRRLTNSTNLLLFTDLDGNNALKGEALNRNSEIYLAWTINKDANMYKVKIFKDTELFYYKFCDVGYCYIEPKSFLVGQYSVVIESIFESGDKEFSEEPFYSISSYNSTSRIFKVE